MKKKLTDLKQIDGKLEKDGEFQFTTLEQIWGGTGEGKYKTLDIEKYAASLADMNLSDLQAHAIGVGIIPSENRERLTKQLVREFQGHISAYRVPKIATKKTVLSKDATRILAEGR